MSRKRIILFNQTGDLTISWDKKDDERMSAMVLEKMKQGFTFYSLKTNIFGFNEQKIKVNNRKDIKNRKVILKDEEAEKFFQSAKTALVEQTPNVEMDLEKRLKTPSEVVSSEVTVSIPPIVGG